MGLWKAEKLKKGQMPVRKPGKKMEPQERLIRALDGWGEEKSVHHNVGAGCSSGGRGGNPGQKACGKHSSKAN